MDKVVWLVAGNKGGVGKSAVAKALVEWLQFHETPVLVVDGDRRTPDVHEAFNELLTTHQFDLNDEIGWPLFSDFLCETDFCGHIIANLPDGISDRAVLYFQRLERLAAGYSFEVKVLFVLNTLPDGLHLFDRLTDSFAQVFAVKNLCFGAPADFEHFDMAFSTRYEGKVVFFPRMAPRIMGLVRESGMPYRQFVDQTGDAKTNVTYAKLVVAEWRDSMIEAMDEVLLGE